MRYEKPLQSIKVNSKKKHSSSSVAGLLMFALLVWDLFIYMVPSLFNRLGNTQNYIILFVTLLAACATPYPKIYLTKNLVLSVVGILSLTAIGLKNGLPSGIIALPAVTLLMLYCFRTSKWLGIYNQICTGLAFVLFICMIFNFIQVEKGTWERESNFNLNTIAGMLMVSSIMIYLRTQKAGNLIAKAVSYLVLIASCILTYSLDCRTVTVCIVLFFLMSRLKMFKKHPKLAGVFAIILCILGVLYPVIYTRLYEEVGLGSYTFLGKDLFTGREKIWSINFEYLTTSNKTLLFGTNTISQFDAENSLHNMYFYMLLKFGVVGTVIYWSIFLGSFIHSVKKLPEGVEEDTLGYVHMCICMLLYGFTETGFLWYMFMPIALSFFGILANKADNL